MNVRKQRQAVDRGYLEKEMSNGIVSESACDDVCLGAWLLQQKRAEP
jgi:hypothetical protein